MIIPYFIKKCAQILILFQKKIEIYYFPTLFHYLLMKSIFDILPLRIYIFRKEFIMNKYYEQLQQHLEKGMALSEALTLFNWDQETLAPIKSIDNTAKTIGILSSEYFSTLINEEVKSLLEELSKEENRKDLNDAQKSIVKELKKQYEEMEHIPKDEYSLWCSCLCRLQYLFRRHSTPFG